MPKNFKCSGIKKVGEVQVKNETILVYSKSATRPLSRADLNETKLVLLAVERGILFQSTIVLGMKLFL